ncbi:MAG TPA: signal peptide peptidase SppA [Acetobacteraceae bacterium]|nr:signal peptide peptidase SppA [Acetobacteraceae bacterium]
MALETDLLLDRRRLKRRLNFWRVVAVASLAAAIIASLPGRGGLVPGQHLTRIRVDGLITEDDTRLRAIEALAKDPAVPAVLLEIDSPGGSVAGGESLHDAIAHVAAAKPVVVVMNGLAASAGYMIAVPATRIFARQGTLTGSIGVLLETGEISGLLGKLGVSLNPLTSGPLKGEPSISRPMSPEARAYLQGVVMDMYDQFVGMVATGRHMDPARVRALGDGRAYTGRQALQLGLIDQIGGEAEARAWLEQTRNIPATLPVVDLKDRGLVFHAFGASLGSGLKTLLFQGLGFDGVWALWQLPG